MKSGIVPMFEHRSVMVPAASLLATLLLALSIVASPVVPNSTVTLPIARRLNTSNGTINILQHDRARVAALKRSASPLDRRASVNVLIMNEVFHYLITVHVGSHEDSTSFKFNLEKNSGCQWVVLYRQLDYRQW